MTETERLVTWTRPKVERLRKRITEVETTVGVTDDTVFEFEGNEFVLSFSRYYLQYLDLAFGTPLEDYLLRNHRMPEAEWRKSHPVEGPLVPGAFEALVKGRSNPFNEGVIEGLRLEREAMLWSAVVNRVWEAAGRAEA